MTAAECVSICDAYGLLESVPTVPDYLTAEGALTWMAYNDGAGTYYDPANPGWTPSSLPDKTLWLDASYPNTVFSDTAGTVPQTSNNGPVGLWTSKVGSYSLDGAIPAPLAFSFIASRLPVLYCDEETSPDLGGIENRRTQSGRRNR